METFHRAKDIEKQTVENSAYRKSLKTFEYSQVIVQSLNPDEDIPWEMHPDLDQFFRVEQGQGLVQVQSREDPSKVSATMMNDGDWFVVPAGHKHRVSNASKTAPFKLYTVYCGKPGHPKGVFQARQSSKETYICEEG